MILIVITFAISKLGMGHLTRQIALSQEIHNLDKSIEFQFIITEEQNSLFKNYFSETEIHTDTSFFSPSFALSEPNKIDIESSIYSFQMAFDFHTQIRNDAEWGRILEKSDIIINDIEFFHNPIAKMMKVPTINISNFTWSDLLKPFANSKLTGEVMKYESMSDLNIKLPFSTKCESFGEKYEELGLLVRPINPIEIKKLESNFEHSTIKILITSISHNSTYRLEDLITKLCKDYIVMISDRILDESINLINENLHVITENYIDFQNYVKIADIVLGKAGYGLTSECVSSGTPFLFWTVEEMVESEALETGILQSNMGEKMKLTLTEVIDQIHSFIGSNYSTMPLKNKLIAKRIFEFL